MTKAADRSGPERRCIVTGEVRPANELVRFAIGPDGAVVPDILGKLPGRGIWVSASRDAVATAVKKNLFSRAAKAKVSAAPDLPEQVAAGLTARVLDLLGLARKAGCLMAGLAKVEDAAAKSHVVALFLASDAGTEGGRNAAKLAARANAPVISAFSAEQLGLALGRANVVHAALTSGGEGAQDSGRLPALVMDEVTRLRGFLQGIPRPIGGETGSEHAAERTPAAT